MPDRRYYFEHREQQLAASRAWKQANPDRARAHNRESARRAALRKKAIQRRRERGRAWYAEHRDQERARARRFRQEHPDKVREYQARFRERHPERAAEQGRRASQKWRDGKADTVRANQRAAAEARRGDDPDAFRRWYQTNLEQQRERGREASRRRSRLKKLGLPPRKIQRVYANERRVNERAGDEFFGRQRSAADVARLRAEVMSSFRWPTAAQLARQRAVLQARQRVMSQDELRIAGQRLQDRLRAAKASDLARTLFPEEVANVARTRSSRLRREVEMDSIARQNRGAEPYDVDKELQRRIHQEAGERAIAIAKRSVKEEHVKRLVSASFPPVPRRRSAPVNAAPQQPRRSTPTGERGDVER
ncbi:hypothetical protein J2X85_001647 [Microbacterium trichothecenolyticum]|uniref:hypothetical protein n=1 Tax=Microbacterium trichothecenolyticum TaxID=69370 RepID=UPI0028671E2C|nr:hypothetical protein [Microbacterium trichothecenolyticum]MDR7184624.1 hypothetical protein [Microbacterium trichothecenolyticum]